jgi:hypothetical protein
MMDERVWLFYLFLGALLIIGIGSALAGLGVFKGMVFGP